MKKIKSFLDNLLKKKHIIPILLFLFTFLVFNIGFRYQSTGDVRPNELLRGWCLTEFNNKLE